MEKYHRWGNHFSDEHWLAIHMKTQKASQGLPFDKRDAYYALRREARFKERRHLSTPSHCVTPGKKIIIAPAGC